MKKSIYLFFLILSYSLSGQYTGGKGDGFSDMDLSSGGTNYYVGGDADGFSFEEIDESTLLYKGGDQDGFTSDIIDGNNALYTGGDLDGFTTDKIDGNNDLYTGGDQDGFTYQKLYQQYIWTGTIGTGWNVSGNWSTNQTPSLRHDVLIPAGAAHWPAVNAGTLSIARNPNNAQYLCNSILVDTGAQMTTRINCFVTNYGEFWVKGILYVKNTAVDAFVNKLNSQFIIQNGTAIMGAD